MIDCENITPLLARPRNENHVTVVGMRYRTGPRHRFSRKKLYILTRDPENSHDCNAIKVSHQKHHIGFLSKEDARKWAPRIDGGACIGIEFVQEWPNSACFEVHHVSI